MLAKGELLSGFADNSVDVATLDERRSWALDQLLGLCRNTSVPKKDSWVQSTLDFLLVHGFFIIRKVDKKSQISAVSLREVLD
jgi:DNA polymerase phi